MVAVSKRTVTHRPRNRFDQVIDSRGSSSPESTGMDVAYQEKASEEVNEEWMKDSSPWRSKSTDVPVPENLSRERETAEDTALCFLCQPMQKR